MIQREANLISFMLINSELLIKFTFLLKKIAISLYQIKLTKHGNN